MFQDSLFQKAGGGGGADSALTARVAHIEELIPNSASTENQLSDKDFVNSSIATNTANFIGTFNSVSELPTTSITNNDYAFVVSTDAQGNTAYSRYKYATQTNGWVFEYTLNNSSFTAAQWAAIQSGITKALVDKMVTTDDVATAAVPGLVMTDAANGISVDGTGALCIEKATDEQVAQGVEEHRPIVPANFRYSLQKLFGGMADTWSIDEQITACETIGAIRSPALKYVNEGSNNPIQLSAAHVALATPNSNSVGIMIIDANEGYEHEWVLLAQFAQETQLTFNEPVTWIAGIAPVITAGSTFRFTFSKAFDTYYGSFIQLQ